MYVRVLDALYEVLCIDTVKRTVQIKDQKIYPPFHPVTNSHRIEECAGP